MHKKAQQKTVEFRANHVCGFGLWMYQNWGCSPKAQFNFGDNG
jgi:hypothetical protein